MRASSSLTADWIYVSLQFCEISAIIPDLLNTLAVGQIFRFTRLSLMDDVYASFSRCEPWKFKRMMKLGLELSQSLRDSSKWGIKMHRIAEVFQALVRTEI